MLTGYEKKQVTAIKKWKYAAPEVIMQSWDFLFLPVPEILIPYLPYELLEGTLEMSSLHSKFTVDKEALLTVNHLSLQDLTSKGLEFSDGLAEKVCKCGDFSELKEKSTEVIMDFLLDIPDIIALALRLVHKVGVCYGYEIKQETDKKHLLAALLAVSGNEQGEIAKQDSAALTNIQLHQLATQIGAEIGMRKFIVQNPYLSIFIGKSAAKWYIKDIGLEAQRIFQRRWLVDQGKWN